jgi:hypothetical protein
VGAGLFGNEDKQMSREKFDLETLKAVQFKTKDRRHLAKAHNIMLGYDPEESETLEEIRLRILDVVKLDTLQKADQAKADALGVSVEQMKYNDAHGEDDMQVRSTTGAVESVLPRVQSRPHAAVAKNASTLNAAAIENERAMLCKRISETGQADQATLQRLRELEQSEASLGLQQAAASGVAVPLVSSGASSNVRDISFRGSQPLALTKLPNLTGNGRWDGRMRRITYIKSDPNSSEDVVTPRWEMVKQDCVTGKQIDLIWPLYQNLLAAVDLKLEKDFEYEKTGKWKGRLIVNERTIATQKYTILDHGDVPGTEDKPSDYNEYFQMVARETCVFRNVTRALIMKVHAILFGVVPITELQGVSDQDLRLKIAVRMGPEFEDMMSAELFGTAASA